MCTYTRTEKSPLRFFGAELGGGTNRAHDSSTVGGVLQATRQHTRRRACARLTALLVGTCVCGCVGRCLWLLPKYVCASEVSGQRVESDRRSNGHLDREPVKKIQKATVISEMTRKSDARPPAPAGRFRASVAMPSSSSERRASTRGPEPKCTYVTRCSLHMAHSSAVKADSEAQAFAHHALHAPGIHELIGGQFGVDSIVVEGGGTLSPGLCRRLWPWLRGTCGGCARRVSPERPIIQVPRSPRGTLALIEAIVILQRIIVFGARGC